jgi:hypothetical protein
MSIRALVCALLRLFWPPKTAGRRHCSRRCLLSMTDFGSPPPPGRGPRDPKRVPLGCFGCTRLSVAMGAISSLYGLSLFSSLMIMCWPLRPAISNPDPLDLTHADVIVAPVVEAGGFRVRVSGHALRDLDASAVRQVIGYARRPGMYGSLSRSGCQRPKRGGGPFTKHPSATWP